MHTLGLLGPPALGPLAKAYMEDSQQRAGPYAIRGSVRTDAI